jgi:hypothetical protein
MVPERNYGVFAGAGDRTEREARPSASYLAATPGNERVQMEKSIRGGIMKSLLFFLILASGLSGYADDNRPDKHGIYRISAPDGSSGTTFVVKRLPGRTVLATAGHVVCADDAMKTVHSLGYDYTVKRNDTLFVGRVKVLMVASEADIALVEGQFDVDVEVMDIDPEPVPIPKRDYVPPRKPVSVLGYGAGKWMETPGYLSFITGQYVRADAICIGGQSGGPAISEGKVVGICSGGDVWYYDDPDKRERPFTWPARLSNPKRLKQLVDAVK